VVAPHNTVIGQWQIPVASIAQQIENPQTITRPTPQARPAVVMAAQNLPPHFACQTIADQIERDQGLPPQLLSAISLTETGGTRTVVEKQPKVFTTWPWSINVEGKGFTFKTKQEAMAKVREFQAMGKRSIDVGCMQINLKFHPDAFDSLEEAFDPVVNILYGANFIKSLSDRHGSWMKAVERYHSATPKFYDVYRNLVFKNWNHERKRHTLLAQYQANQLIDESRLNRLKEVAAARANNPSPQGFAVSSNTHDGSPHEGGWTIP
jgi:hypothetical protein